MQNILQHSTSFSPFHSSWCTFSEPYVRAKGEEINTIETYSWWPNYLQNVDTCEQLPRWQVWVFFAYFSSRLLYLPMETAQNVHCITVWCLHNFVGKKNALSSIRFTKYTAEDPQTGPVKVYEPPKRTSLPSLNEGLNNLYWALVTKMLNINFMAQF